LVLISFSEMPASGLRRRDYFEADAVLILMLDLAVENCSPLFDARFASPLLVLLYSHLASFPLTFFLVTCP